MFLKGRQKFRSALLRIPVFGQDKRLAAEGALVENGFALRTGLNDEVLPFRS